MYLIFQYCVLPLKTFAKLLIKFLLITFDYNLTKINCMFNVNKLFNYNVDQNLQLQKPVFIKSGTRCELRRKYF